VASSARAVSEKNAATKNRAEISAMAAPDTLSLLHIILDPILYTLGTQITGFRDIDDDERFWLICGEEMFFYRIFDVFSKNCTGP